MGSVIYDCSLLLNSDKSYQDVRNCVNKVNAATSVVLFMHKDVTIRQILSLFKENLDNVLEQVISLQVGSTLISITYLINESKLCVWGKSLVLL